jgi:16S rRNA (cytosine1402-N4)-methyltransferase
MGNVTAVHDPVMVHEVVEALGCRPGGTWVDATVGAGGHAAAILEATAPGGFLVGIDRDREILALAAERLGGFAGRFLLLHGRFGDIAGLLAGAGKAEADGVLIDLGISSLQVDRGERGFSFRADAPLDMRMDRTAGPTALDLLRGADEEEIARIIFEFGEEPKSRRIARAIRRELDRGVALTTFGLAELVAGAIGRGGPRGGRLHPATRTFQALRIAVNGELEELDRALEALPGLLAPGGRACVISYHSLEDRAVKRAFRALAHREDRRVPAPFELIARKPLRPGEGEVRANPRARSARLRALARAA